MVKENQDNKFYRQKFFEENNPTQDLCSLDSGIKFVQKVTRIDYHDLLKNIDPTSDLPAYRPAGVNYPSMLRTDDLRKTYKDTTYPYGLVGKIFNSNGRGGSGALVGENLVITAGHMVPWDKEGWWMRFVPDYYNDDINNQGAGHSLHGDGFESYVEEAYGFDTHGAVTGYDFAILKLYNPLGKQLGYFGAKHYDHFEWSNMPIFIILGYPFMIAGGEQPSSEAGISMTIQNEEPWNTGGEALFTPNADITEGNSGGPVYFLDRDSYLPYIVGVITGGQVPPSPTTTSGVIAGGPGIANLVRYGRQNWS